MKRIVFSLVLLFVLQSCSSDDAPESVSNFYALTVGNSWEYRWYSVGVDGIPSPMSVEESISIVDTEMIGENLFYKFKRIVSGNPPHGDYTFSLPEGEHFEYYRDSLGYLVNEEGVIKFSSNSVNPFVFSIQGFGSDELIGTGELQEELVTYTTQTGAIFECKELIISYEINNEITPGKNWLYYSNGIGLIKDDKIFLASGAGYHRILESYTVQ